MKTDSPTLRTLGILISGRGSNMQALIEHSKKGTLSARIALVISDNPEAAGLDVARKENIPVQVLDPKDQQAYVRCLKEHGVEWVCLAGFMRIVRSPLLEAFPNRIVNIHPSLLPSFPGLHVHERVLKSGVKYSGCTVHLVDEGVDTGPILAQAVVPVESADTPESLAARILVEEHRLYAQALQNLWQA